MTDLSVYHFLRDGRVYVLSAEEAFTSRFHLAFGDRLTGFETADLADLRLGQDSLLDNGDFRKGTEGWVLDADKPDEVRFGVDLSNEWRLDHVSVAYLETKSAPARIRLVPKGRDGSTRLPVVAGCPVKVAGWSASHRCVVDLSVSFFAEDGSGLTGARETLPAAQGGRRPDQYHPISFKTVAPEGATHAEVAIVYAGPVDPVPGFTSFIFLADFSVTLPDCAFVPGESFRPFERFLGVETGQGQARLYAAPLDVAYISAQRVDVEIRVAAREDTAPPLIAATTSAPSRAAMEQIEANLFSVSPPPAADFSLFVDDRRIPANLYVEVGAGSGRLRLASDLLDGKFHRLAIRDATGCVNICETFALLPFQQTPWTALQEHDGAFPPPHLSPAAGHRYRSLLAHLERQARGPAVDLAQVHYAHGVLIKGFLHNNAFRPLVFPAHAEPQVSIVIPVRNKFEVTYFCLCALLFTYTDVSFEVIIVDDGSDDRTMRLSELATNVVVCRNETSSGFVRACNRGAELARGAFILFLNNDTEPAHRWLDELVASFTMFDNVGLAGAKLISPDGRLQEAGGIIWRNGNPWNYGRIANPFDPRFSYTRQVDYVSGAAIMIAAPLWRSVGGFSEEFAPAYFEDTDLAFKVRDAGYKTMMVATSIVYHFEGVTSGTDVWSGIKRFQEINRPKFKRKWVKAFRSHGEEGARPDLEKDRGILGRALFLDYQTPRPDMDAGSYAAHQEMRLIQQLGYKVTFFPTNAAYLPTYFEALQREGIEMLHAPFFSSAAEVLERRGGEFDLIYITRYYVGLDVIDLVRRHAPRAKILFCTADLHFLRQLRRAVVAGDPGAVAEAMKVRDEELGVMRRVDLTLSYNEVEHAVILSHNPTSSRVMKLPWVEKAHPAGPGFEARAGIAFLGGFNHHPNVEAVEFFAEKVMPRLAAVAPDAVFHIYGSNMPPRLSKLASPHIEPHGFVGDLAEVFDACKVFVAPLLSGAGLKGKVMAALARGVPCVLSPVAAEGIGLRHGDDCLIAETPEEWVAAVNSLAGDAELWERISARGRSLIASSYSAEKGLVAMRKIVEAVGLPVA